MSATNCPWCGQPFGGHPTACQPEQRPVATWSPSPTRHPFICPVCHGGGATYGPVGVPVECHACKGTGIVWSPA